MTWPSTTLVRINDEYDREMSDTGAPLDSRFGRYLAQRVHHLDGDARTNPTDFLCWAWSVATPPVMAPGYVRIRPDLKAVRLVHAEADRSLLLEVDVPLQHHLLTREVRPPHTVQQWEEETSYGSHEEPRHHYEPRDERRPALMVSATLRIPAADWKLHQPGDWTQMEELLVDDAKNAVTVAVDHINHAAGPQIAALLGNEGGQW